MHGFSSTSVGKSRLTMEPPQNFGVFNKGRASAKFKVDDLRSTKRKGFPSRIFSEDRFLNSRRVKSLEKLLSETEFSEALSSSDTSKVSSSLVKTKSSAVQLRSTPIRIKGTIRRDRPPASSQCASEDVGSDRNTRRSARRTPPTEPGKPRSPAQSASWIIEKDGCSLPSTSSEVAIASAKSKTETPFLDVRNAAWSKILKDNLLDAKVLLPPGYHETPLNTSILPTTTTAQEITLKSLPDIENRFYWPLGVGLPDCAKRSASPGTEVYIFQVFCVATQRRVRLCRTRGSPS
ncbi:hypothetical protein B0F90DRAFT_252374 [Multifurca ochricompacta]|uniref:Uncharacterized protein n=1 Tax=Multifurca ochricompacta TaxID=376703 RepID=A0AAD4M4W2_9AGAM|nr:hypothetical protein B0F90DRAFT_252374 [Multifurca ochricompacta]